MVGIPSGYPGVNPYLAGNQKGTCLQAAPSTGTATNNSGLGALLGLGLPLCSPRGDGRETWRAKGLTAAQRSQSSRAQSQINAPTQDHTGRRWKMVGHRHHSPTRQEMKQPRDYFIINSASTMNPKIRDWKCLPGQELVVRALDKKRHGVGIGTRPVCGRDTKEQLCPYPDTQEQHTESY